MSFILGAIAVTAALIVGSIAAPVLQELLKGFWTQIRDWLNGTAADVVQKYIGYDARKALHKAVNKVDHVVNMIRNTTWAYYRSTPDARYYDKVKMTTEAPDYEFNSDLVNNLEVDEFSMNTMDYVN